MKTSLDKLHRVLPPSCPCHRVSGLRVVGRDRGNTVGELLAAYQAVAGREPFTMKDRTVKTHFQIVAALQPMDLPTIENAVGQPPAGVLGP